jgi:alkylation response protein AidB-like acyl-CoA dehydrogenase
MLAMVADEALQIHGGMGLMGELRRWSASGATRASSASGMAPARYSLISRTLLRPLGG